MRPNRRLNLQGGQAVIIAVLFMLMLGMTLTTRATRPVRTDATLTRDLFLSKQASALSDAGSEDLTYRIRRALHYDATEYVSLNGLLATTTVTTNPSGNAKTVSALGSVKGNVRLKGVTLFKGDQVDFNYAIQSGNGGFSMANSSSVVGNVYSNGSVVGAGNTIRGSVVSAGPSGLISGIHATSSAWAHTIQNSTIDKDAYYIVKTNTTVGGTSYPGSQDKAPTSFPVSDAQIAEWEADAEVSGVISSPCPYKITSSVTIGPVKINCDLEISNNAYVTIAGPVWVNGNIEFKNSSGIALAAAIGASSVPLIADKTSNRLTSSVITITNSTTFANSGTPGSFLFLISANTSKESGGSVTAIDLNNTASGAVILYSNHGSVSIGNSSTLKSVTGYLISMKNSAQLIYDDGLESALFDSGPGGSWNVINWKETQ